MRTIKCFHMQLDDGRRRELWNYLWKVNRYIIYRLVQRSLVVCRQRTLWQRAGPNGADCWSAVKNEKVGGDQGDKSVNNFHWIRTNLWMCLNKGMSSPLLQYTGRCINYYLELLIYMQCVNIYWRGIKGEIYAWGEVDIYMCSSSLVHVGLSILAFDYYCHTSLDGSASHLCCHLVWCTELTPSLYSAPGRPLCLLTEHFILLKLYFTFTFSTAPLLSSCG